MAPRNERGAQAGPWNASGSDQLGGTISPDVKATIASAQAWEPLFAGRTLVGFVITRPHGFDAITADGRRLGRFNTQQAAGNALFGVTRDE